MRTGRIVRSVRARRLAVWLSMIPLLLLGMVVRAGERQQVRGHVPAVLAHMTPESRLPSSTRLDLVIGLPLRNQDALTRLLKDLYDPSSPSYHHYLTPQEFTTRFGPTEKDYDAAIAFAKSQGFKVTQTHPNRMLVDVSGTATEVERAFGVSLGLYKHPTENRMFFAADKQPSVPAGLSILAVGGLDNYSLPRPRFVARPLSTPKAVTPQAGSGPGGAYMGSDFRAAYVPDSTLTGSGQTVGLLQFDGYTAGDIAYYESKAGLPAVALSNVLLDGFTGNPTGWGGEIEVSLDIEMVISMAPGVSNIIVYEAGPYGNWYDILNRMATDNLAKQFSCSWYSPGGGPDPVTDQIFQEMAVQGQSFFNASGDDDVYTGLIDFPGDTPYITQVGGTTLTTSGPGGPWASERVWNWGNGIGSGGGISTSYPIPSWQTNINMAANQGSSTMRNTPDVALVADNVYVRADGQDFFVGGTSCAAPLWAGFDALVNQQARTSGRPFVGFINPAIDSIGSGQKFTQCFHDITDGDNTSPRSPSRFYAVPGYDLCTGWGTPAGQNLIDALANPEPLLVVPAAGFLAVGASGGPFTVTAQNLFLTNTGTNSLNWTVGTTSVWLNATPSAGTLSPAGPAATVTASLSSSAYALPVGVYTAYLWFTNQTSGVAQSRQFTLQVVPNEPPGIVTQPVGVTLFEGRTATFNVGVTGTPPMTVQWKFNGSDISAATNILLTLTNVQFSQAGSYTAAVTNAFGWVLSSNALLTVNPPPPCVPPPAGLVSWWRGENNALDSVGANNGILVGNTSYGAGMVGLGFVLDGSGDSVVMGTAPSLQLQDFTIECWIQRSSSVAVSASSTDAGLFEYGYGGYGFGLHNNGGLYLGSVGIDSVTAGTSITDTNFHHVAVTKSGMNVVFYEDGVAYSVAPYGTTFTFTTPVAIGSRGDTPPGFGSFLGTIDEVSVYSRALTASEIQSIYAADISGKCFTGIAPSIVYQPTNQTAFAGGSASLGVTVQGSGPLSYQWIFDGTNIAGANAAMLVFTNVQFSQAGTYSVLVTNSVRIGAQFQCDIDSGWSTSIHYF